MQFIMITQNVPLMIIALLMSYRSVVAQGIDVEIICDVNGTDSDTHWRVNGSSLVSRNYLFNVVAQDIVNIAHPGQNFELMCDVSGTESETNWRINGSSLISLNDLSDVLIPGHTISGRNIVVENIMMNDVRNGSRYQCIVLAISITPGNLTILYVAGVPSIVPTVTISDVPYMLSWGEPFNNLDPILSYTVSCSGDNRCPPNFTTTDNTTRNYTITNLIPVTDYTFSVIATNSIGSGEAGVVMITTPSSSPDRVPDVMVNKSSVRINGRNLTLTLSWGEPFSYFDPIISYTVSCSGDVTCPPNFTTTDYTTRRYTVTNLTPFTNYTFSVVATNSIGSGEAGLLDYSTTGITKVNVIELQCDPVTLINQCTVTWSWNSLQENITNFSVISSVGRFNVSSQNTSHTFPVLSLPGGASSGEVTVIVIAVNELGQGPPSEVARVNITVASSVISAISLPVCTPAVTELYNINIICTIHPDSTADQCVVMAMADDEDTKAGITAITKGMATVVIDDLQCGVTYNITAEGMLNETLVGSRSSHGSIAPRPCPMISTDDESDDELSTGATVAITFVVTFIITLVVTALITVLITSLFYKHLIAKSTINQEGDSHSLAENINKRHDPTYATANTSITMDTNPAYGTTATIKMDTNPVYATTSH